MSHCCRLRRKRTDPSNNANFFMAIPFPLSQHRAVGPDLLYYKLAFIEMERHGLYCPGSAQIQVLVACECGNEPSGCTNTGNFLTG